MYLPYSLYVRSYSSLATWFLLRSVFDLVLVFVSIRIIIGTLAGFAILQSRDISVYGSIRTVCHSLALKRRSMLFLSTDILC